jgi:hypothetical protein
MYAGAANPRTHAQLYPGWPKGSEVLTTLPNGAPGADRVLREVRGRVGSQEATDKFFRLFLVPGMAHCGNGPGTVDFGNQNSPAPIADARHDLRSALDAWVAHGTAPDRIIASRVVGQCAPVRCARILRKLCTSRRGNFACRSLDARPERISLNVRLEAGN